MRKNIITGVSLVALSAGMAQAGGFELQTLNTSIMYADVNQASISYASIDVSVQGENPNSTTSSKRDVVKDQTVTNVTAKFDVGDSLSFGLGTYRSGSIQLSGGNENLGATYGAVGGNLAPSADLDLNTTALMARYNLNDNLSFIGGVTQNAVGGGNVTTLGGTYDVGSTSSVGYFGGIAYSVPEIALRAELVYQPKAEFTTCTSSAPTAFGVAGTRLRITGLVNAGVTALQNPLVALNGASDAILQAALTEENEKTTLALPETVAFNFQTGIAADTLLTASYRKASWGGAQINIAAPIAIETEFSASEAYSIGLGRRFTDNLSASLTYSKEEGSSAPATSLFTVSNGSKALSLGIQYKRDNMTISGGISQRNVGDVTVNAAGVGTMKYTGNSVTAMGVKIAFAF